MGDGAGSDPQAGVAPLHPPEGEALRQVEHPAGPHPQALGPSCCVERPPPPEELGDRLWAVSVFTALSWKFSENHANDHPWRVPVFFRNQCPVSAWTPDVLLLEEPRDWPPFPRRSCPWGGRFPPQWAFLHQVMSRPSGRLHGAHTTHPITPPALPAPQAPI